MKVFISQIGIKESVINEIEDAQSNINSAKSKHLYSPSNFKYSGYVRELGSKLNRFGKELTYIKNSLVKSDTKYKTIFEDTVDNIKNKGEVKINVRSTVRDNI